MGDEGLAQEVLTALLDDAALQLPLLAAAIARHDLELTRRLAHYSKGACASVGANASATALERLESLAARGDVASCLASLRSFEESIENLRRETAIA